MSTISSQSKFYQTNKDKVLAYKKQYYQKKNKAYIALKKLHIQNISKRESDKIIKTAIDNNNINIRVLGDYYELDEFIDNYNIHKNLLVTGIVSNRILDLDANLDSYTHSITTDFLKVDDIITHIKDTQKYSFSLILEFPISKK